MGVSVKDESRSTIGYFGTGFKFAVATLLRNNCTVRLYPGDDALGSYLFGAKEVEIRGKEFNLVYMIDETTGETTDLGFTTDLGRDWQVWQAFRELYCNAQDEGGKTFQKPDNTVIEAKPGVVNIMVTGAAIDETWSERDKFILSPTRTPIYFGKTFGPISSGYDLEVFRIPNTEQREGVIYYNGIRVGTTGQQAYHDFNLTRRIQLTEDRTMKDPFTVIMYLCTAVVTSDDPEFIKAMVFIRDYASNCFEATRMNYGFVYTQPSTDFMETVGKLRKDYQEHHINNTARIKHIESTKIKSFLPKESVELNAVEKKQLSKALRFCRTGLGFNPEDYPIIIAEQLGSNASLGLADMEEDIIYISRSCFRKGTKTLVLALIEEYTHLRHRVLDETFEQKLVYLEMIASLGEQITGEPL